MATEPVNPLELKRTSIGNVIKVCLFGTTLTEGVVSKLIKPAVDSAEWQLLGKVVSFQPNHKTEDDAITAYDPDTNAFETDNNTKVTSRSFQFTTAEMNALITQLTFGTGALEKGKKAVPGSTNKNYVEVWIMNEKYDQDGQKSVTYSACGKLMLSGNSQETNKIVQPQWQFDQYASPANEVTADFWSAFPVKSPA